MTAFGCTEPRNTEIGDDPPAKTDAQTGASQGSDAAPGSDAPTATPGVAPDSGGNVARDARPDAGPDEPTGKAELLITVQGNGTDFVTSSSGQLNCTTDCRGFFAEGERLTLTATSTRSSKFVEWSGDCSGNVPVCTLAVRKTSAVTARFASPGAVIWSAPRSGSSGDFAIKGDSLFIVSGFMGTQMIGDRQVMSAGSYDSTLAEFGLDGKLRWLKQVGGPGSDGLSGILVIPTGILVGGLATVGVDFGGQVFAAPAPGSMFGDVLVKYDFSGNLLWYAPRGGGGFILPHGTGYLACTGSPGVQVSNTGQVGEYWFDVPNASYAGALTPDGGLVTSGFLFAAEMVGGKLRKPVGDRDAFVARLSSTGTLMWYQLFSGSGGESCGAQMAVDPAGDVYVTGDFDKDIDIGGTRHQSNGASNIFVAKLAGQTGTPVWSKAFGGADRDVGQAVLLDGDTILIGGEQGSATLDLGDGPAAGVGYLARLSSASGEVIWSAHLAETSVEHIHLGAGDIFVAGSQALARLHP